MHSMERGASRYHRHPERMEINQPRVARNELPWGEALNARYPARVASASHGGSIKLRPMPRLSAHSVFGFRNRCRGLKLRRVSDVTQILERVEKGDGRAAEELLPLVYEELRKLAAYKMAHEPSGQTLQATALVHEAWLRIVGQQQQRWENRAQFFIAASEAMRRILVERARRRQAIKHV